MQDWDSESAAQLQKSSLTIGSLSEESHRGAVDGKFMTSLLTVPLSELTVLPTVNGRVQCPCSTEFLSTLSVEFIRARAYHMVMIVAKVNEEQQIVRLRFLIHELQRLMRYPRLFGSATVEARFLALLGVDSRMQFGKACTDLLLEAEIRKIVRSSHENETRKSYLDGSRNWENFLLDGAPGTPYGVIKTTPKSSFQIIPAVGMRIVADFEREEAEIIHFVEQVSLHDMSCPSSLATTDSQSLKYL